jgi:hypothetical protein
VPDAWEGQRHPQDIGLIGRGAREDHRMTHHQERQRARSIINEAAPRQAKRADSRWPKERPSPGEDHVVHGADGQLPHQYDLARRELDGLDRHEDATTIDGLPQRRLPSFHQRAVNCSVYFSLKLHSETILDIACKVNGTRYKARTNDIIIT